MDVKGETNTLSPRGTFGLKLFFNWREPYDFSALFFSFDRFFFRQQPLSNEFSHLVRSDGDKITTRSPCSLIDGPAEHDGWREHESGRQRLAHNPTISFRDDDPLLLLPAVARSCPLLLFSSHLFHLSFADSAQLFFLFFYFERRLFETTVNKHVSDRLSRSLTLRRCLK